MASIKKLNPNKITTGSGQVAFLEIEMSAAEAVEAFGVGAENVSGFYRAFEVSLEDAKKLKRDFGAKLIQNEAGVTRKQLKTKDDSMLDITSLYGDVETEKVFTIMERVARRVRGARPAPDDAPAGSAVVFGLRNCFKQAGLERDQGKDELKRSITIQGSRTEDGKPSFDEAVVLLSDETAWPANIADFKSDAVV